MEGLAVLLGLAVVGAVIGVPIAAFVALSRTGRLRLMADALSSEIYRLRGELRELQHRVETLQKAQPPAAPAPSPERPVAKPTPSPAFVEAIAIAPVPPAPAPAQAALESAPVPEVTPAPEPVPVPVPPVPVEPPAAPAWMAPAADTPAIAEVPPTEFPSTDAVATVSAEPRTTGDSPRTPEAFAAAPSQAEPAMPPAESATVGLEERLGGRLFIWIGGIAIALAGAFLFKYSIDQGWLGPKIRCGLGAALGLVLLGGGEWMRAREGRIAQSLSAAGVAVLYASLFAAIWLYQILDPATGFLLLAALTGGAILMALRQGPFVGLLGISGGVVTPAIVSTGEPNALVLFAYLLALQLGSQVLTRRRGWWWSSALAVGGGFLWAAGWLVNQPRDWSQDLWLALFLLATCAATAWAQRGRAVPQSYGNWQPVDWMAPVTNAAALVMMTALVAGTGHDAPGWVFFGVLAAGQMLLARLRTEQEPLAVLASVLALLLLSTWRISPVWFADETGRFILAALAMGVLFGLGGFGALWGAWRPVRWASLSALSTAAIFLIAYGKLRDMVGLPPWGLLSLVLAAPAILAAATLLSRRGRGRLYEEPLGVYALAACGFIAFAIPLELEQGWVAVGWALMLPAIAVIESRLHITWFRNAAWVAGGIVLSRLLPGPWLLHFETGATPIFNWLLYGYGIPLACLAGAAWLFRRERDDALATFLEAGAVVIGFLLVTLELHHYFQGGLVYRFDLDLVQVTGFAVAWLLIALGLARAHRLDPRPARLWGMRIVTGLAATMLVGGSLLAVNPLLVREPVGVWPLVNWLAYAYALPALLLAAISRQIEGMADRRLAIPLQGLAGILGLLFITLEIRQLFHGAILTLGTIELAELSCMIAAWLLVALGLAYAQLRRPQAQLSYGMRVVIVLAVAALAAGPLAVLNPLLSWQPVGSWPILNLLIVTYGLPAALLLVLGRAVERLPAQSWSSALLFLAGGLGLYFVTLEIRQLFHGTFLTLGHVGLDELSCMIIAWLVIAFALFRGVRGLQQAQTLVMARVVTGLACAALLLGSLLIVNPLLDAQLVGAWPLLNWLVPAYAVTALLVAVLGRHVGDSRHPWIVPAMSGLALVLGFAFVTLEIRQWFHGTRLDIGGISDIENYAYSVGWIAYGVALLAAGIAKGGVSLRWASLAVIVLAVGKVFLYDAAVLTGLYRVASFLGLGLSLMAIGYVYQRVVFRRPQAPATAVASPPARS